MIEIYGSILNPSRRLKCILSTTVAVIMLEASLNMKNRQWKLVFSAGKRHLANHENEKALEYLQIALGECPVELESELASIFYYLGVTLQKLGMTNCALKSFRSAQRLDKSGHAAQCIRRYSNGYGMAKQISTELDDWKAFYSVHLYRYLVTKKTKKMGTDAEHDMISDLIYEAWRELSKSVSMGGLSDEEKMSLFREVRIVYPTFDLSLIFEDNGESAITVDFTRHKKVTSEDHCFCGSGLPYKLCCGRIPGEDELLVGII